MHEYLISASIAEKVIASAESNDANKVVTIDLEIGDLLLLDPEQVEFWLKELFKGTIAQEAEIRIKQIKPKIRCSDCNYEGGMKIEDDPLQHIYFPPLYCPECNSPNIEIEEGRECLIRDIKISV